MNRHLKSRKTAKFYVLACVPRSGTTLMCELIRSIRNAGRPGEYLKHIRSIRNADQCLKEHKLGTLSSLAKVIRTKGEAGGVIGVRIFWPQVVEVMEYSTGLYANPLDFLDQILELISSAPRFIFMDRKDKNRQAVSHYKGSVTGQWFVRGNEEIKREVDFDPIQIYDHKVQLLVQSAMWEQYFKTRHIIPLKIWYEDFVADMKGTVNEFMKFMEISYPANYAFTQPQHCRQADESNEEMVRQLSSHESDFGL